MHKSLSLCLGKQDKTFFFLQDILIALPLEQYKVSKGGSSEVPNTIESGTWNRSMVILKSMRLFVGSRFIPYDFPLIILHAMPFIYFHLWCMIGGSVWIWMRATYLSLLRSTLFQHLLTCTKMSQNDPPQTKTECDFIQTFEHIPKTYQTWKGMYAKRPNSNQQSCWGKGYRP